MARAVRVANCRSLRKVCKAIAGEEMRGLAEKGDWRVRVRCLGGGERGGREGGWLGRARGAGSVGLGRELALALAAWPVQGDASLEEIWVTRS